MDDVGQQALLRLLVHLLFLVVSWWAIQAIRFDPLIKKGKVIQARILMILLTIGLSALVSNFFLTYLDYSTQLRYLFK
ncbi:DUF1146 family protein [Fictibacillus sp. Mic-4]|uniref:DUF1146 family protein n=1 Tax=Fictibacillus TaxID=1329200 RepID=UPI00047C2AC4|nr:DUF1146 family protein [Fictibacillus gelatini]